MKTTNKLERNQNQKRTNWNRIRDIFYFISILVLSFLLYLQSNNSSKDIIRTKGIIIEDKMGRERILIGSPIPFAKNRARTDSIKIKRTWAKRFGAGANQYMEYYKNYSHQTNGLLVLDEKGWDKVILGDPTPDPIFGKRIGKGPGLIINDSIGLERTGYGLLTVNGEDRVTLGLDKNNGTEGLTLSILPDGSLGVYLNSDQGSVFMGSLSSEDWRTPTGEKFHGIIMEDSQKNRQIIKSKED